MCKAGTVYKEVTDDKEFISMPFSSQVLYFFLSTHADESGVVNDPELIKKMLNVTTEDELRLIGKGFIKITVDEELKPVVVIINRYE